MDDSRKLHNRDRLSELPDSLIITILSFLEINDAVRTSVLSKRWKDRWAALLSLKLWRPQVGDLDRYRSFIYGALLQWKGAKILKFDLPFSSVNPPSRDLDSWLLFAIGKQVEELRLCLGSVNSDYSPLQRLYTCSSIRKLTLSYVKLNIPENVQLSQLTSLTVEGEILLSGRDMTRLLTGAPLLEELALLCTEIREDFNIRSESLKKLDIVIGKFRWILFQSVVRIRAPNLSSLEIRAGVCGNGSCLQLDVPSLTTAILNISRVSNEGFFILGSFYQIFRSIRHAHTVSLSNYSIELLLDLKKTDKSVEFPNAKHLKVYNFNDEMLLTVVEMFPKLLTLAMDYDSCTKDGDSFSASEKKIHLPLPHLKTCEISLFCCVINSSILRVVEAVLENGEMLEKMVIRLCSTDKEKALGSRSLEKLLSMRRSSPKARVFIIKDSSTTHGCSCG